MLVKPDRWLLNATIGTKTFLALDSVVDVRAKIELFDHVREKAAPSFYTAIKHIHFQSHYCDGSAFLERGKKCLAKITET